MNRPACALVHALIPALLLCACLFETDNGRDKKPPSQSDFTIRPDLSIGNQWMYLSRQFTRFADGSPVDTVIHFIHYGIEGDSLIGGVNYRILSEEDLAVFNTDQGLVKSGTLFAVLDDSSGLHVNMLRGTGGINGSSGRLPFKASAASFDTLHFEDEITALKSPLSIGQGWVYRAAENPLGHSAATKVFIGKDTLEISGKAVAAMKFQVLIEQLAFLTTYEWYEDNVKVFSRSSAAANSFNADSNHWEEEYLGKRYFTRADTDLVLGR